MVDAGRQLGIQHQTSSILQPMIRPHQYARLGSADAFRPADITGSDGSGGGASGGNGSGGGRSSSSQTVYVLVLHRFTSQTTGLVSAKVVTQ